MGEPAASTQRKSLTKSQLETPEAIELLGLLQAVTDDGRLLDDEITALQQWVSDNSVSTLPAVDYLNSAVRTVLEDGRVTPEERAWLQKAIETVLPREQRDIASLRRREAKVDDRRSAAEEKARQAELARRSKPQARFDFMTAGVAYEGRATIVKRHCYPDCRVFLVREPQNAYSRNAIKLRLSNGQDIGYVPEAEAFRLAGMLDSGFLHSASVKKLLSGRQYLIPVIWGELYEPDAPVEYAVAPAAVPASQHDSPSASGTGGAAYRFGRLVGRLFGK